MAVHLHRSERTEALLHGLADLLRAAPEDPFAPDLIAVPTPGIERFITQGLGLVLGVTPGRSDGVCANVDFPSPAAVVSRVISQATGIDPSADPWLPDRAVWPLLAVIDASAHEHWCAPLARYLGLLEDDPLRQDRRFAVARRLAGMFAAYGSQRPQMLLDWADGRDTDGAAGLVPEDLAWQPHLWRAVRAEIGLPSLAERLGQACATVRSTPEAVDLPPRLSVFGATRLPEAHLQTLAALGADREVHLWLAQASPALWTAPVGSRHHRDDTGRGICNPLLRSFGRDARELSQRLQREIQAVSSDHLPTALDATTLLGHLQRQIRDDADPHATPHEVLAADDRSLQIHACHGQFRQAEVILEVLLGLLQDDPSLEARDILIMCPDLDAFAPLLSAAFCAQETTGSLRLRIADRTPEQSNPVLTALTALLDLVTGRLELSTVLDFAAHPAVRTRFGFDDDSLERLADLTEEAAIRWGLDDRSRADFLVRVPTGTWSWGLDRLLLGTALSEDGLPLVGDVLPVDDVNSGDVELLGHLAELVTRMQRARDTMTGRLPMHEWVTVITDALENLVEVDGPDAWQLPNALGVISGLAAEAQAGPGLSLADIRWLLAEVLTGRPTRSNFRSGDLTVCGLAPMRSIPHRVICLVGLDDGAFPRAVVADGDDVMARDPLIGERDIRSEDRQLLLDAIMAATDHLVITYAGADERTNQPRPPCVPLGDLLDAVDATARTRNGDAASTQVLVHHPLQPFDQRNFLPGALGTSGPFAHDAAALQAALRASRPRTPAPGLWLTDLPCLPATALSPQELGRFLGSPAKAFLRERLGLSLRDDDEEFGEDIPIELTGLTRWQVGTRSLRLLARGEPPHRIAAAERARGTLPPGPLGEEALRSIGGEAQAIAGMVAEHAVGPPTQVDVALDLDEGWRIVGTVPDVHGARIVRSTFSKAKPKEELQLWPEVLAIAAARPEQRWSACLIHRGGGFLLTAPPADQARRLLTELVQVYRRGMRGPLPLFPATSRSYAQRRAEGKDSDRARRSAQFGVWERATNERTLDEVVALWGQDADFEDVWSEPPAPEENWFDEHSRFGMLARRVWEPLLAAREAL